MSDTLNCPYPCRSFSGRRLVVPVPVRGGDGGHSDSLLPWPSCSRLAMMDLWSVVLLTLGADLASVEITRAS